MRKIVTGFVTVGAIAAILLGGVSCAKKAEKPKEVTVNMFQLKVEIKDALDAYAAKYSAAHPGTTIKVETLGGGGDYGGALKAKS